MGDMRGDCCHDHGVLDAKDGDEGGAGDKGDGEGEKMAAESLPGIYCGMRGCNSHCCVAEEMRLFLFYLLRVLGLVSVAPLWAVRLAGERFV